MTGGFGGYDGFHDSALGGSVGLIFGAGLDCFFGFFFPGFFQNGFMCFLLSKSKGTPANFSQRPFP
jgi:hypothetical protein